MALDLLEQGRETEIAKEITGTSRYKRGANVMWGSPQELWEHTHRPQRTF